MTTPPPPPPRDSNQRATDPADLAEWPLVSMFLSRLGFAALLVIGSLMVIRAADPGYGTIGGLGLIAAGIGLLGFRIETLIGAIDRINDRADQ